MKSNRSKFFCAQLAFEIPEKFEVEGRFTREIPEQLVGDLMDLFEVCEFESAGACNPPLLIVKTGVVTPQWIAKSEDRINAVLKEHAKQQRALHRNTNEKAKHKKKKISAALSRKS